MPSSKIKKINDAANNRSEYDDEEIRKNVSDVVSKYKDDIEDLEDNTFYSPRQSQVVIFYDAGLSYDGISLITKVYEEIEVNSSSFPSKFLDMVKSWKSKKGEGEVHHSITSGTVETYYYHAKKKYKKSKNTVDAGNNIF